MLRHGWEQMMNHLVIQVPHDPIHHGIPHGNIHTVFRGVPDPGNIIIVMNHLQKRMGKGEMAEEVHIT